VGISDASSGLLRAPEPLNDTHDLSGFNSGEASLDDWLRRRARANQASGVSRTYVLAEGERVIGYHSLAAGAITVGDAPGRIRRNMPDPIPMAVLGRLAIDRDRQGKGLGHALLRDALLRTYQAAEAIGIRGLLVHALSPAAKRFYLSCGFSESPAHPMTLMITLSDARDALRELTD
jgi:GNAT superfamily N-acetyltransferase